MAPTPHDGTPEAMRNPMFTGQFAPVSAAFVALALVSSGLGHSEYFDVSMVRARQFVTLFMVCGTVSLAL